VPRGARSIVARTAPSVRSASALPVELLADADVETVQDDLTDAVAANVRPFGGNPLQLYRIKNSTVYRRSKFSGGELLLQFLDLRAIHERGISGNSRAQFS